MKDDNFDEDIDEDNLETEEVDYDEEDNLEEGFMQGYEKESNTIRCANCKSIIDEEGIEEEFAGFIYKFCCQDCLKEFEKKQK